MSPKLFKIVIYVFISLTPFHPSICHAKEYTPTKLKANNNSQKNLSLANLSFNEKLKNEAGKKNNAVIPVTVWQILDKRYKLESMTYVKNDVFFNALAELKKGDREYMIQLHAIQTVVDKSIPKMNKTYNDAIVLSEGAANAYFEKKSNAVNFVVNFFKTNHTNEEIIYVIPIRQAKSDYYIKGVLQIFSDIPETAFREPSLELLFLRNMIEGKLEVLIFEVDSSLANKLDGPFHKAPTYWQIVLSSKNKGK